MNKRKNSLLGDPVILFAVKFVVLFAVLYGSALALIAYTSPGGSYSPFLAEHLNAIHWLRWALLHGTKIMLNALGYAVVLNEFKLLVAGHNLIVLNYDCLGFGVMSFFTAFVVAFPKPRLNKTVFWLVGIICIQLLNLCRLSWLALNWKPSAHYFADQHTIFNISIYIIIAISLYFWIKSGKNRITHVAN